MHLEGPAAFVGEIVPLCQTRIACIRKYAPSTGLVDGRDPDKLQRDRLSGVEIGVVSGYLQGAARYRYTRILFAVGPLDSTVSRRRYGVNKRT